MSKSKTWIDRRQALLNEIATYFMAIAPTRVQKAIDHIKSWGETIASIRFQQEDNCVIAKDDECVADHFSPQHRQMVADWMNRYADLLVENLQHMESQRSYSEKNCWARDDSEYEEWLSTKPPGEIQVWGDRIEVIAFGYTEGFAARLPKRGKKGIGKTNEGYLWQYPLSALDALKTVGIPVVYSLEVLE